MNRRITRIAAIDYDEQTGLAQACGWPDLYDQAAIAEDVSATEYDIVPYGVAAPLFTHRLHVTHWPNWKSADMTRPHLDYLVAFEVENA